MDFQGFFTQQCLGMAARISANVNGGGIDGSNSLSSSSIPASPSGSVGRVRDLIGTATVATTLPFSLRLLLLLLLLLPYPLLLLLLSKPNPSL
jgi:hypothetical protein